MQPTKVNSSAFQSVAKDSFTAYIGFSECSGGGEDVRITSVSNLPVATVSATPTASNLSLLTPVISGPDQNSTQSISTGINSQDPSSTLSVPTHSSGSYDKKVKIANRVLIPVAFLGIVLLAFLVCRNRQKTKKEEDSTLQDLRSPQEDPRPYLQQKAELEAEEKRKDELEARERRYEIGNEGERYELPVEEGDLMIRSRQELRGEEHSRELETSC